MTLKISTYLREGEWGCQDGIVVKGKGETAGSWCDDNPKLRRVGGMWELIENYEGFTPRWRLDFYKLFSVGIHNILLELDNMGAYGEMNRLLKAASKLGHPRCGRQFINFLILTAPDWRFNYTIGKRQGEMVVMTCSGGKGCSPFSKLSKYYKQHTYKLDGRDNRKIGRERRH